MKKIERLLHTLPVLALLFVHQPPTLAASGDCGDRFTGETIRWIVPSSPGGGYDTYSRLIAPYYEKYTGASVVVQNRPGAGGRIGATRIMEAEPDGLTIGILNGPGLMMAAQYETPPMPNPAVDFTILGRVAKNDHVWAIAVDSPLPALDELLASDQERPLVFGTRGPGTLSFVDMVLASATLGLEIDIVTGYGGSRDGILAALRGEIDAVAHSYGSLLDAFEAGEMRPWLQVTAERISNDPWLAGVPHLGGPDGLAARAAKRDGRDPEGAGARADALVELTGAGRLIAAPKGLEADLATCMRELVYAALTDPGFRESAKQADRPLAIARGEETEARLRAIQSEVTAFVPALREAAERYGK